MTKPWQPLSGSCRQCGSDQRQDFEIQAMDMGARKPDDYRRLQELGVAEALATPWNPYDARLYLQQKLDAIERFADTIIAPLN